MANELHTLKIGSTEYPLAPMWDNVQNKCINASIGAIDINKVYDFTLSCIQQGSNLPSAAQYGSLLTLPYRKPTGNSIPDFGAQILIPNGDDSKPHLYFRTSHSETWDAWKTVLDSSNYTGYTYAKSDVYTKTQTDNAIAALVDSAPDTLNTLNELAAALGDDKNFSTTVTNLIAGKADKTHSHSKSEITDFTHTHSKSDITDFPSYTAGTGISISSATINHSNSVTAVTTAGLYKIKYDAQGHITGKSSVTANDLPSHTHDYASSSHTHDYLSSSPLSLEMMGTSGTKTPFIDFHYYGGHNDFDYRIICVSGVSGWAGGGTAKFIGTSDFAGNITAESNGSYSIGADTKRFKSGYFSTSVYATSGFYEQSDERLKDFTNPIKVDLDKLSKLTKSYFYWKNDRAKLNIGVSAQEIKEIYPEIVEETESGYLNVSYDKLSVIALTAVDELHKKNKELEERIQKLESIVNELIK